MSYHMSQRYSRRTLAAALPLAAMRPAIAQSATVPVGVATTRFHDHTNSSLAQELKAQGVRVIQLFFTQKDSNYWKYGLRMDLSALTPERAKEIAGIYRAAGISIHGLGVYPTLIHPDGAERTANLSYLEAVMKLGNHMGIRTFISEMGHYTPPGPAPPVPFDFQDEVWKSAVDTAKELGRLAEANGATVLLEPFYRGFLASAKRTRVFLEEVGSPRIRALLDPANLLEVNDLEEMFSQLQPWIGGLHAKDRKLHTADGVAAGQGDLDYPKFVSLAAKRTPGVPLIIEYAGSKEYRQALAHLRNVIGQAGMKEG